MNNNVKSATTAGLLGIFLGAIGAHWWYLGDKKKALIHVYLLAGGLGLMAVADMVLPMFLSMGTVLQFAGLFMLLNSLAGLIMTGNAIWGVVEGVMILTQGDAGLAQKGYNNAGGLNNNQGQGCYSGQGMSTESANENGGIGGNASGFGMPGMAHDERLNISSANTQTMNMERPETVVKNQQTIDSRKKKKIITGVLVGVGMVAVIGVAVAVVMSMMKANYGETYRSAKELSPKISDFVNSTDCKYVMEYVNSAYITMESYQGYAESCMSVGDGLSEAVEKLGETSGVKKNKEIKAQFEKVSEGLAEILPNDDELRAKINVDLAWHEFVLAANDLNYQTVSDAEIKAAAKALIESGNDALKIYGEGWEERTLQQAQAYRDYYNLPYSDPNRNVKRTEYNNLDQANKDWRAANVPDYKTMGGIDLSGRDKLYKEFSTLRAMIAEEYEKNYDSGSGDCFEFLGEVECD